MNTRTESKKIVTDRTYGTVKDTKVYEEAYIRAMSILFGWNTDNQKDND